MRRSVRGKCVVSAMLNMVNKYAIQEGNIYNFDKTGFQMGILSGAKVVISSERRGQIVQSSLAIKSELL